jgi:hypothetical protein
MQEWESLIEVSGGLEAGVVVDCSKISFWSIIEQCKRNCNFADSVYF